MKIKFIGFIIVLSVFFSCNKNNKEIEIKLNSKNVHDTINVFELITNKLVTQLSKDSLTKKVELKIPIVAKILLKEKIYLTILEPNKNLNITIRPDSSITTNKKSDSLLNYLWKSNNEFVSNNSSFIFNKKNTDSIPIIFNNFKKKRAAEINKYKLSPKISEILHFQNKARLDYFLFYYGMFINNQKPNNFYYDFIKTIPKPNQNLKSFPAIYLYKYEIEYLRKNKLIKSIPDFLRIIEEKTEKKDLADFLKAIYIKDLTEAPSNWKRQEKLLTTEVLSNILKAEIKNKYSFIFKESSLAFYKSQNGEKAYLFQAEDQFGNQFSLESLIGKVIFIDTWATWCAPCLKHRPQVLKFAKKYKNRNDVEIILISVDSSKDKWLSFLKKEDDKFGKNLFIKNGMNTKFGNNYNIKSIPRYILIGKDGKIINSNINEPSISVEREIEKALKEK